MKILIVGHGNIGKHMHKELLALNPDIYDPNQPEHSVKTGKRYDIAFICVPTDKNADGSCDISVVTEAVRETDADVIVIKSTVPPGTTDKLISTTGKKIIFSPEQYGVTVHCKDDPGFVILGGDRKLCAKVADMYSKVKDGSYRYYFTNSRTAELSKYMLNCFLALKVTFCCEMADVAEGFGISYPELRELFVADERVGRSHTYVYADKPYYDSHCFNKDVPAFLSFASAESPLISCMDQINRWRKEKNEIL